LKMILHETDDEIENTEPHGFISEEEPV
jgi:hypothetical protein